MTRRQSCKPRLCACAGCGVEFTALHSRTKFCTKECKTETWHAAHPERVREIKTKQRISESGRRKRKEWEADNADHLSEYRADHYDKNKEKYAENAAKYAAGNPDVVRAAQKKYEQTENGRQIRNQNTWRRLARIKNAPGRGVTAAQFNDLCVRYDFHCVSCVKKFDRADLTMDHCHPISKGGEHDIDNIQPMCMDCNRSKRNTAAFYRPGFMATKYFADKAAGVYL